jgi:hypothetical protein
MFNKSFLAMSLVFLTLMGCSGSPVEKVESYISEKEFSDAIEWIADRIEDEPDNSLYHALASEVILKECAATNCFDNNPKKLEALSVHLQKVQQNEYNLDDSTLYLHDRLVVTAQEFMNNNHHPKALSTINYFMPYGSLHQKFIGLTFNKIAEHIKKGEIPPAITLLESLANKIVMKDPNQSLALLLQGYLANDTDSINKALDGIQKTDTTLPIHDDAIDAMPYAIFQQMIENNPNNGGRLFIHEFRNILKIANIPYFETERGQAKIANAVYAMSRDNTFIERAILHTLSLNKDTSDVISHQEPSAPLDQDVTKTDPENKQETDIHNLKMDKEEFTLHLVKVALLTNPKNEKSWAIFLEPATAYAQGTGNFKILYEGLNPGDIPSSIIDEYNESLFTIANELVTKNESILEVIQHIILPADNAENIKTRVTKLLNEAMISAVNNANYDLVYAYASFQPDIARLSRQKVVSITIDALENKWQENEFEGMDTLSNFLSQTMGIDFSLDSLLLQSYDDHLVQTGVQKLLNSDTANPLFLTIEESKVELGNKFAFLQKHFSKQPEVLDNLLKSLIVKAEGTYGVPVSLYRLYNHFSKAFKEEDKHAYLISAIKSSLSTDDKLSAVEFAEQGEKVINQFKEIPTSFIVSETMKRVETLEDSKELWGNSSEVFKKYLKDTRPQFATLMRAIDAYENGNHETAAKLFTILSDTNLIEQARPYLQEYVDTIKAQVGVYALDKSDYKATKGLGTFMMYIDLIQNEQALQTQDTTSTTPDNQTDLLAVKVTLISRLGAIKVQSPKDLTEDSGKIARIEMMGRINPNTMEISLPDEEKTAQDLPLSFEKIFGSVTTLNLEGDRIVYNTQEKSYTFKRVFKYNTDRPNFPSGKYAMTLSDSNNDKRSKHILPIGSILEFEVNERRKINPKRSGVDMGTIYPLKGQIMHPSSATPRPMEGYYNPDKQVISFAYSYPLVSGGSLDATIKCQTSGADIICAGHNKHWGRQRYSYITYGKQVFVPEELKPASTKINRIRNR